MVEARFIFADGKPIGFSVGGHSGYDRSGRDIVCASVSSAVMLTCNAVTEVFKVGAKVDVENDRISLRLDSASENGMLLIESLRIHLEALSVEYPKNISLKISEV